MKILTINILLLFNIYALSLFAQPVKVRAGIEVLKGENFEILAGKRVGLITNATGVDSNMESTIDVLHNAPNVKLTALFAPEHGVRGDIHAGDAVATYTDPKTKLPVYSLYGRTKAPTAAMLKNIDVLVYDIQDVGCRSFTYISTMGLAMEAAAKNKIEFIVLDRPNPLGGQKVEGPLVEDGYISFVSQYKIPYIYGLTCGELALLLNSQKMIEGQCDLYVVKMDGWHRNMIYSQTGLPWISPSPHIPHPELSFFYPMSGILGELNYMSIGVGYTLPFQTFAAEWINADDLSDRLNALKLEGVFFRPIHYKPFYAMGVGRKLQGVQVHIMDYERAHLSEIQFYVMQEIAELYPAKSVFKTADSRRFRMFDQVVGSNVIRQTFAKRNKFEDIKEYWYKQAEAFKKLSEKYYLYQ